MRRIVIRETALFLLLLVTLSALMHPDLLESTARFSQMTERGNFLHPLLYTALIYLLLLLVRGIFKTLRRLFRRTPRAR
jgi:hypothetical protein